MCEYFWVMTIEATVPDGRGSTYGSGIIEAQPPATRQDLFRVALAHVKENAGLAPEAQVEVKFFYLEPNVLPQL